MIFGLTGDTHNNLSNIQVICEIFNRENVEFVIHTGDITLPKSLDVFKNLKMPLIGVYGNNDQNEKYALQKVITEHNFDISDGPKALEINDKKIFIVHDPNEIEDYFYSPNSLIVHGHTHRYRDEIINNTHIFNPGECAGMIKGSNSVGIVDLDKIEMKIINF